MKNSRSRMKSGVLGTLLAGVLLSASAVGWASPPNDFEMSAQRNDEGFRLADFASENTRIQLADGAWDAAGYLDAGYVRPIRKALSVCASCEFHFGVGGTYHSFQGTKGVVVPMTVSWDSSRWEFGVFRFSTQSSDDNRLHTERVVAQPYWATSLSRRWPLFERGPFRGIFGFGVSYRTETDILSATHWNFSSQFGLRYQSQSFPAIFELSARHWSNGGIKTPNRGQDFSILTVRFDR